MGQWAVFTSGVDPCGLLIRADKAARRFPWRHNSPYKQQQVSVSCWCNAHVSKKKKKAEMSPPQLQPQAGALYGSEGKRPYGLRKCVFSSTDLQIEAHAWYARHVALTLCAVLNNKANILAESEAKQFPDPH